MVQDRAGQTKCIVHIYVSAECKVFLDMKKKNITKQKSLKWISFGKRTVAGVLQTKQVCVQNFVRRKEL
jgi:hypothetical protein